MANIQAIPSEIVDPGSKLDPGNYLFSCEGVKEGDYEGRFLYDATFRVLQPESHKGQLQYERWWIGSDEDPEAAKPETWSQNAGRMAQCCDAMSVPMKGQNPDIVVQQMLGKQLCGRVEHKAYTTKAGKSGVGANITRWGIAGSMTPEVFSGNGQPPLAQTPMPMPGAVQAAQPMPPAAPQAPAPIPGAGTNQPPVQGGPTQTPFPPMPPQYQ
jgi:hypothetical protein